MDDPALQMEVEFVSFERREKPEYLKMKVLDTWGGEPTTNSTTTKVEAGEIKKNFKRERERIKTVYFI